jgi:DMSO/TMAO reductase YedYZ molybdopterin-dependent catalytic subunit
MKKKHLITRRAAITTGIAALGALIIPGCKQPLPPNYGNILRMGDNFTYVAHRALLPGQSLAKEYRTSDISSMPATGTINPADTSKAYFSESYDRLLHTGFENWQLSVEGLVARPTNYSLNQLKSFPARTQITRHTCEEGWTAIAEWTGLPLGTLLEHVGISPKARWVNFYSYDGWLDSIDLLDAFHPQTLLAYGMNGKNLSIPHGAPLRLRLEKQIGFKSMKYLERIVVSEEYIDPGDIGWAWYNGI